MTSYGLALDLSFDHPSGWYLYEDNLPKQGGLAVAEKKTGNPIDDMADKVSELMLAFHSEVGLSWIAVEDVFLATYKSARGASKQNVDMLVSLVDLRAPIMTDARRAGIAPRFFGKSWDIDEACNIEHWLRRPQRKAAFARLAETMTGLKMPEDMADACCIGFWGASKYKQYQWTLQAE